MNCGSCKSLKCLIINHVKPENLANFDDSKTVSLFKKGQFIFKEGALVKGLYFVREGKIKVFFTQESKEHLVREANNGEILGHRGLGGNDLYPISARALEDSLVCFFSQSRLMQLLQHNPLLAYHITLFFADELDHSESMMITPSQKNESK
jgi:CRP/FNR family transcriptional regulator, anaerobic regulatory protein